MKSVHFLIPGNPDTRTGGYLYDRQIMQGLTDRGWSVTLQRLDDSFPTPTPAAMQAAAAVLAALPEQAVVVIDGLALGAMPTLVALHKTRLRLVGLVHHPLALETGLDSTLQQQLYASELAALRHVRLIIVTSPHTVRALAHYQVAPERCVVVPPGTEPAPLARGSGNPELSLLCAASLTPRKGHAVLLRALAQSQHLHWRLRCAGSPSLDPATAARLRTLASDLQLTERIEWLGELDAVSLARCYEQADVFVLPSWYEGYGMVLAEALARGLPILSTTAGAIPDTVPAAAGLLVPPGDEAALAHALEQLLTQADLRHRLAAAAKAARSHLIDWPTACAQFEAALDTVLA